MRAGITPASTQWGELGGAALAYVPEAPAEVPRGALYTLARSRPALINGQPGAALALRYLRHSYYTSLCRQPGRALDSAVCATAQYLRSLAWQGHALADCALAAAVVQGTSLWLVTAGTCIAYLVRPVTGGWRQLAAYKADSLLSYRAASPEQLTTPTVLEPGDLVLLTTQVPETLIQSCLLTLLLHEPGLSAQDLADTLTQLAAGNAGSAKPLAVVLDCQAANPAPASGAPAGPGYRALAVPSGFAWDGQAVPGAGGAGAQPQSHEAAPVASRRPEPPPPAAVPERAPLPAPVAEAMPESVVTAEAAPSEPPAAVDPLDAIPAAVLTHLLSARQAIATALPRWMTTQNRLARVLAPGTGLLAGVGAAGSWVTGQWPYVLAGCSLSGIVLFFARRAQPADPGSAATAKDRLLGGTPAAPVAPSGPRQARPQATAPDRPRSGAHRTAAPTPDPGPASGLVWTRNRLVLPPVSAVAAGCLDIVSLRDAPGRINAQLILICPPHLLAAKGGYAGGIYVVLHDLITDRQQMVAWLAPGQRCGEAVLRDVDGYSGNPAAHVRWLRGHPRFDLASTRLRVGLTIDRCKFADPVQKQHLESLEIVLTETQVLA